MQCLWRSAGSRFCLSGGTTSAGAATQYYKFIVAVGYGVFYAFVVCTSESILSFMYIFPLTSMLVLFKDRTYMVQCGIGTLVISIASSVHKFMNGMNSASNVNDYTLQASCIILCYICYVVSIDHLNESDGALTNSIKADLERVVTTVEQVKVPVIRSWTELRLSGN